jgi:hypothetical protein
MGLLIDGKWHDKWYDTESTGGRFKRQESAFRNWITPDGSAGPGGRGTMSMFGDSDSAAFDLDMLKIESKRCRPPAKHPMDIVEEKTAMRSIGRQLRL